MGIPARGRNPDGTLKKKTTRRAKLPPNVFFNDSETAIHARVAAWLALRPHLLWCHVPNGEYRAISTARRLRKLGVSPGVPDVMIFSKPQCGNYVGAALELKTAKGRTSKHQDHWLEGLRTQGWATHVAHSDTDAIAWLTSLGY